jgi:hypothetical protein
MDKLTRRRKEVRALRAGLVKDLHGLRQWLNPSDILDNLLVTVDPELRFVSRLQSGIRRNPLLAAGLIAGASWLISNGSKQSDLNRRRQPVKTSKTVTNNKGEDDDTQQHDYDTRHQRPLDREKQSGPRL